MYACEHFYTQAYALARAYAHADTCAHTQSYAYTYMFAHTSLYTLAHMPLLVVTCVHKRAYAHTCAHTRAHTRGHTRTHTRMHVHTRAHVCIHSRTRATCALTRTHIDKHAPIFLNAHTHALRARTRIREYTRAGQRTHAYARARTRSLVHMRYHARTRAHTWARTCTHTQARTHTLAHFACTREHVLNVLHWPLRNVAFCCMSQCIGLFEFACFLVCSAIVQGEKCTCGRLCNMAILVFKEDWAAIREVCQHLQLWWCHHVVDMLLCQVLGRMFPENVRNIILSMVCEIFWALRIWPLCFPCFR